jgi:ribonuclease HI
MPNQFIINTDGASKGNPGKAGIGVALYRVGETEPFATVAEPLPDTTNNVAEYSALIRGLQEALLHGGDDIEVRTDSELMARQIEGRYAVKSPELQPLFAEAKKLLGRFQKARVVHVRREFNRLADELANQGIANASKPKLVKIPSVAPAKTETKIEVNGTHSRIVAGERWFWKTARLVEAAQGLPVKTVLVADFDADTFEKDCWFSPEKPPTVRRVAEHARRIYEADLSFPIILAPDGTLMDGGHRLSKCWLEGKKEIKAVQLEVLPTPDEKRPA